MTQQHTNSSFRTLIERTIVREIIREHGIDGLRDALIAAGESAEAADEWCDDPNAIPTSLRAKLATSDWKAFFQKCHVLKAR